MPAIKPTEKGPGGKADFGTMQTLLANSTGLGRMFELRRFDKIGNKMLSAADVFNFDQGVYVIHAFWFIAEVCDLPYDQLGGEAVDHYVVYNAGRRVLFIYPEVPHPHPHHPTSTCVSSSCPLVCSGLLWQSKRACESCR